tara:strand:- start:1185 stop:1448 length:264 start_codon:yes stop_codon:yes gene_type:complete
MYFKIGNPLLSIKKQYPIRDIYLIHNNLKLRIKKIDDKTICFEEYCNGWVETSWVMIKDTYNIIYKEKENRHKLFLYGHHFTLEQLV